MVANIPDGSAVVFVFGEIDCREGILVAVEKMRYDNIEQGVERTVAIFIKVRLGLPGLMTYESSAPRRASHCLALLRPIVFGMCPKLYHAQSLILFFCVFLLEICVSTNMVSRHCNLLAAMTVGVCVKNGRHVYAGRGVSGTRPIMCRLP